MSHHLPLSGLLLGCLSLIACTSATDLELESTAMVSINGENMAKIALTIETQQELGEQLADWIADYQATDEIPGVAVALVYQDQILLLEGMGQRDLERNLPVTPQTLFHIASTQKSMTAMLAAIAVDRNHLAWDAPVVDIDPDFELSDAEATKSVSLRHLLSMRSGIADDEADFEIENTTAAELFEVVAEMEPIAPPGEEFSYSNLATSVAGYLVTLAAGGDFEALAADYEALLTDWILDPIGMNDAVVQFSDAQAQEDVALPYVWDRDRFVVPDREDFDNDPLAPSGSLKASISDMAAYMITQVQGGVTPNGERIVSTTNLQETWQPRWDDYAMGWVQSEEDGLLVLSHEGLYDNFLSIIGMLPEYELGFVVLTNSNDAGGGLVEDVTQHIVELVQVAP